MISRRALFGLSVGAVAAAKGMSATAQAPQRVIGVDFGKTPAMMEFDFSECRIYHIQCRPGCAHTLKWLRENKPRIIADSEFSHVERCG